MCSNVSYTVTTAKSKIFLLIHNIHNIFIYSHNNHTKMQKCNNTNSENIMMVITINIEKKRIMKRIVIGSKKDTIEM
jgi:hypothetical protein